MLVLVSLSDLSRALLQLVLLVNFNIGLFIFVGDQTYCRKWVDHPEREENPEELQMLAKDSKGIQKLCRSFQI